MDTLLKAISQFPNGTNLIVEWSKELIVFGIIDTIYETNNELDSDDKAYQEFHACLLHVMDIQKSISEVLSFSVGDFIEISMQNSPLKVYLQDKTLIWSK